MCLYHETNEEEHYSEECCLFSENLLKLSLLCSDIPEPVDPQICQAMCAIMKLSFEEEYRRAMNELGGLQVVADLIHLDQDMYGMQNDPINMALRRYAGMAVTNLTFGDVVNKVQRTRRCGVNDS